MSILLPPGYQYPTSYSPPPGIPSQTWEDLLNAVRQQEGVSSYGVLYLPPNAPENVGRAAASYWLSYWYQKTGSLVQALARYGACGSTSVPGQPCGMDYARAVLSILGGTLQSSGQAQLSSPPPPTLGSPTDTARAVVVVAGLVLLALAGLGLVRRRGRTIEVTT